MTKLEKRKSKLALLLAGLVATLPAAGQSDLLFGEPTDYQGEPALYFVVSHMHFGSFCLGRLYLTPTRVAYEVAKDSQYTQDSFQRPRSEVQMQFGGEYFGVPKIEVRLREGRTYNLVTGEPIIASIRKAWTDFAATRQQLLQKVREEGGGPAKPAPAATATVQVEARPGGADFYVDDEFRGTTSSEGRIKVSDLPPGEHRLRLSKKDYQEWSRTLTLEAGESRTVEVQLPEAIPEATLALADVLKLLEGGVTPARLETIVKERGVSFELTDDAERKLQALGATDSLLLVIAKAKK